MYMCVCVHVQAIGETGTVTSVMESGDVRVRFNDQHNWAVNPDSLTRVGGSGQVGTFIGEYIHMYMHVCTYNVC